MSKENKITSIKVDELLKYPFKQIENISFWDFEYIINELRLISSEMNSNKFDPTLFKCYEIYDNPHGSDEQSYRHLVLFKDYACCIYGYTGDRGESHVSFFSKNMAKELYDYFVSLINYNFIEDFLDIIEEDTINLSDQYTTFIFNDKDGKFYSHINSPKWSYCFGKNMKNLFYLTDENEIIPIEFVSFKTPEKHSWELNKEDEFIIAKKNGYNIEVAFERLLIRH